MSETLRWGMKLQGGMKLLASLWLTLGLLAWIAVVLTVERMFLLTLGPSIGYATAIPFAGLFFNLIAAIFTNRKIRQQIGLLIFHLALAAIAVIAASGRFTYLKGHVEITNGLPFNEALVVAETGALHSWGLDKVSFLQGDFSIEYGPNMSRRGTKNEVFVPITASDGKRVWKKQIIGDDKPLKLNGYSFYTSSNKGFALAMTFMDAQGEERTGTIHLPQYPMQDAIQSNEWTPAGSTKPITFWLELEKPIYDVKDYWTFRVPENPTLVITDGPTRHELKVGQSGAIAGGFLRFEKMMTWMGYLISYDPTKNWIFAASLVAVLGMAWHAVTKFFASPWDAEGRNGQN